MDLAMFQDDLSAYSTLSHNSILNINFVWLTLVDILIRMYIMCICTCEREYVCIGFFAVFY